MAIYDNLGGGGSSNAQNQKLYLYNKGDQCADITGGWTNRNLYANGGTVTFGDESITMQGSTSGTNNQYILYANNQIAFDGYKRIVVKFDTSLTGSYGQLSINTGTSIPTAPSNMSTRILNTSTRVDFSDNDMLLSLPVSGESYVFLHSVEGAKWTIKEIYLEK